MKRNLSRRQILQGATAAAGAASLLGPNGRLVGSAWAQAATGVPTVLVIMMRGGYNALFANADAFAADGTFGVTTTNMMRVGTSELYVDRGTYGTLPAPVLNGMATVGVNHGSSSHDPAKEAQWLTGGRSYPLILANAMGGTAAIKCALVGSTLPTDTGIPPAEGTASMQTITDLKATLSALGQGGPIPADQPARAPAAAALDAAKAQSAPLIAGSSNSLRSFTEAYDGAARTLRATTSGIDYPALATAYGVPATSFGVSAGNFRSQMLAAEVMMRAGTRVVVAGSNFGWDTHGDSSGADVRTKMTNNIMPGLRVFLQRMMADPAFNITVAVIGDFARSLPGSDHARMTSATVWGRKIRTGASFKATRTVGLPAGSPGVPGFWSLLAAAAKSPTNPFGANPHAAIVLP